MGVIGCLPYIVEALRHQYLWRNAFPFAIKMAEGIAHGLEKAENIVVIAAHTGQIIDFTPLQKIKKRPAPPRHMDGGERRT